MIHRIFKISFFSFFITNLGHAAAFERSAQPIHAFFKDGNYAELSLAYLDPDVTGRVLQTQAMIDDGVQDYSTGQLADEQWFAHAALKLQLHPQVSFGLLYDQPFGIHAQYDYAPLGEVSDPHAESADIQFDSHTLSAVLGYQPNTNWNLYAGTVLQRFSGKLSIQGQKYDFLNGYHVEFKPAEDFGWLMGISYHIPAYFFRSSLTYRAPIDHKLKTEESIVTGLSQTQFSEVSTPESVNLDIHSALSPLSFGYLSVRWVNWSDFVIQPPELEAIANFANVNLNLIDYQDSQWSGKFGLGYQLHPKWVQMLEYVWDAGAGNPASTLNPSDGYHGLGLISAYQATSNVDLNTGIYYLKMKKPPVDQSNPLSAQISGLSEVSNNSVWILGLQLGYHF